MLLPRITMLLLNIVFLGGGVYMTTSGLLLSSDSERILVSHLVPTPLPNPFLYYCATGGVLVGALLSVVSVLGVVVVRVTNSCLLAMYIFCIVVLLVAECVLLSITLLFPQYLGVVLDGEEVLDRWQRNYGLPGRERYTTAIDLVQTKMECCGVREASDFKSSWWTIRELGAPNLTVPWSCCLQTEPPSYLDPSPLNPVLCQHVDPSKNAAARHLKGCLEFLELWMSQHVDQVLKACSFLVFYQLVILLVTIFVCVERRKDCSKPAEM